MIEMSDVVRDFALAFEGVDESAPKGRSRTREYQPGIGPLNENEAVKRALDQLKSTNAVYPEAGPRAYSKSPQICDLALPGLGAIECNLIGLSGTIQIETEHWSQHILHPDPGDVSAIGDAIKLKESGFEQKGILVFGYEHTPAQINPDTAVKCCALLCSSVVGIRLGARCSAEFTKLIHPSHQLGKVYGGK